MLTPSAIASPRYYLNLSSRFDYYHEGGEAPGRYLGSFAEELELSSRVRRNDLCSLFDGNHPKTGKPLVQKKNYGEDVDRASHSPGTDLVTSHDKSFDVLYALADRHRQKEFEAAHAAADEAVVKFLEKHAAFSRAGEEGTHVRAKLVVAAFQHTTNRLSEPFVHGHLLPINAGLNQDGKTRAIVNHYFYEAQMAAGALHRLRYSNEVVERLGVELETSKDHVRAKGVPLHICDFFSTRRRQIEEALKRSGKSGPAAADIAAKETRTEKRTTPLSELSETWRGQSKELGFDCNAADRLYDRFILSRSQTPDRCVADAITTVEKTRSVFSAFDIIRHAANNALGKGISEDAILAEVDRTLADERRVVTLARDGKPPLFTTPELLRLEKSTIELAKSSASSRSHAVQPQQVFQALKAVTAKLVVDGRTDPELLLTHETRKAVAHITRDTGRVACIDAPLGTDRVTVLEAAKDAWELRKLNVIGVAATKEGCMSLEQSTGIKSHTLGSLLYRIDPSPIDQARHHARQLLRAARHKETSRLDEVPKEPLLKHDGKAVYEANKDKRLIQNQDLKKLLS